MSKYHLYKKSLLPTGKDILGPFYRPGSPFRTNIDSSGGANLFLTGTIKDSNGNLLKDNIYIEFWQADQDGKYDEAGPGLRGIQQVINGTYHLETIKPGFYDISDPSQPQPHEYRCSHIHAKIWIDGIDVLTTQLYFKDSPYDDTDHWFSANRCVTFTDAQHATFDFVV